MLTWHVCKLEAQLACLCLQDPAMGLAWTGVKDLSLGRGHGADTGGGFCPTLTVLGRSELQKDPAYLSTGWFDSTKKEKTCSLIQND